MGIGRLILAFGLLSIFGGVLWLWIVPRQDVSVPISFKEAGASVRVWWSGTYDFAAYNANGAITASLWENWGPAYRTNIYETPEGWVIALGAAGDAFVALNGIVPRLVASKERLQINNSETWRYVGAVDFDRKAKSFRFYYPNEKPECFAMLGAGYSPHRKRYQVEHSC